MVDTVKHTPGPWKAVKAAHGPIDIFDQQGQDVVTVYGGGVEAESKIANANLIAAAPELLEALHLVGMSAGWQYLTMETRKVVEAALDKAEGRS